MTRFGAIFVKVSDAEGYALALTRGMAEGRFFVWTVKRLQAAWPPGASSGHRRIWRCPPRTRDWKSGQPRIVRPCGPRESTRTRS